MRTKEVEVFTINFEFSKIPLEQLKTLRTKLERWLGEQKENLPFEKSKFGPSELRLESETFLFFATFSKGVKVIAGAQNPEKTIDTLNEVGNKIFSYLNTIMPESYKKGDVISHFTLVEEKELPIIKTIVNNSQIAQMSELMKAQVKPIAIVLSWKEGERSFVGFEAKGEKCTSFVVSAINKFTGDIPIDAVASQKEIFFKLKKALSQITTAVA